jgi:hypothetical protein
LMFFWVVLLVVDQFCHDIDCKRVSSFQYTRQTLIKAKLIPYMDSWELPNLNSDN